MRQHFTNRVKAMLRCMMLLSIVWLLASCGTGHHALKATPAASGTARSTSGISGKTPSVAAPDPAKYADEPTRLLLAEARKWLGTKYKYGGNDTDGVDCSGFVTQVFSRSLNIKLPRTSAQQQQFCNTIERGSLTAGDLVFFTSRGGSEVGHVGIYIGDGKMIHSSSSQGVIVTPLDQKYYVDNYYSSGRVSQFHNLKATAAKSAKATKSKPVPVAAPKPAPAPVATPAPKATPKAATTAADATPRRRIHISKASVPPATAASMEADRNKALNQLINQIEDSIFTK